MARKLNKDTIKVFIPSQNHLIDVTDEKEDIIEGVQQRFLDQGLYAWLIYIKGD